MPEPELELILSNYQAVAGIIKVMRNNEGNCVHFVGSTVPTYWNGCLSAEVDLDGNINIINNVSSTDKQAMYEMKGIPWRTFRDAEGAPFENAGECKEYIDAACNVSDGFFEVLFPPKEPF